MTAAFDIVFVLSVAVIWFMIGYQFILSVCGWVLFHRSLRERDETLIDRSKLPPVTLLVPAHNEAKVIERTVQSLLALDYPADRIEIMIIDDASTDSTPEIADLLAAQHPQVRVIHRKAPEGGRGKSAALNAAWREAQCEILAVYDADNRPEPDSLQHLVCHLVRHPRHAAALGQFRTGNRRRNMLTRFINIEGLSFQWIVQAGRWQLLKVSTLPGTNFVIRRSAIEKVGGWDEQALTEDAELSVRLYQAGYRIAFIPYAVTWEQEPETFGVWLRQRTRWVRGNNYVLSKLIRSFLRSRSRALAIEMLYSLSLYYLFFGALIASDIIFILGLCGIKVISVYGPFGTVWAMAILLYVLEITMALSYDGENSLGNVLTSVVMYFTYCQAWLLVVCRAFYADYIQRKQRVWDKTIRFDETPTDGR